MFSTPAVAGDQVFVGSCNGVFHAIDRETGRARWTYEAIRDGRPGGHAEFHGRALVTDELVITSTDDRAPGGFGHIYALERTSGRPRWKIRVERGVMSDILRSGSRLYAFTLGDELLCLDLDTGRLNWTQRVSAAVDETRSAVMTPVLSDGVVYAGGQAGTVVAIDALTGQVRWRQQLRSVVVAPLAVHDDGLYVPTSGPLVRLGRPDGSKRAELDLGGQVFGAPLVVGTDVIVFASEPVPDASCGSAQVLKAIDTSLDSVRWTQRTLRGWSSSRPYLWHGNALVGGEGGQITAYRPSDGKVVWSDTLAGVIRGIGSDGTRLYVGTLKGTLYAYEPPR